MLMHPATQTLNALGLGGMAKALEEQQAMPGIEDLAFEERLALLIDREKLYRMNRRLTTRLKRQSSAMRPASRTSIYVHQGASTNLW